KPRPLDVRFIAATNRDLEVEVTRGTFRQDLYFRLNGATLVIPPLRERPTEIPGLARAFLEYGAQQASLDRVPELAPEALEALMHYSWPGNIRELRNTIERAVLLCGGGTIQPRHLPLEKMRVTFATSLQPASPVVPIATPITTPATSPPPTRERSRPKVDVPLLRRGPRLSVEEERAQIENALLACGGNQTRAAQMLGIGRRTLINRVKEFGLARPRGGGKPVD
ncbi:MAG TPA: helix-turn-helix domain-containing protein, partial [Kofleriaceae bacterium]